MNSEERLPPVAPPHDGVRDAMANVTVFIGGAIIVCIVTAVLVTIVAILQPANTAIIATIVGIGTPVTMALLAAGLQGIHRGVNGRLSQLLQTTAEASHASGRAEAIRQLYFRQANLKPGTAEYDAVADQIRAESLSYFQVIEKRA